MKLKKLTGGTKLVGWAYLPNNNFLVQLLDKKCNKTDIFVTETGHSGCVLSCKMTIFNQTMTNTYP